MRRYSLGPWQTRTLRACPLLLAAFAITGCAVGRNDANGQIVLGFEAGRLVETANQAIASGTEGLLTTLGLGAGPAGAIGLLAAKFFADSRAAKARHEGENNGWDSREKAAGTQQPLTVTPPAPGSTGAG